jgi:hypothetical protein
MAESDDAANVVKPSVEQRSGRLVFLSILVAVVALAASIASLAVALPGVLQPSGIACDPAALWDRYPPSSELPRGWRYDSLSASDRGISGSIQEAAASSSVFSPSVYFSAICSPNPGNLLTATKTMNEVAQGGRAIGFRQVGDEVIALQTDNGYSATWRTGSIVANVNSFSEEVDLGVIEDLAEAVQRTLTASR